MGIYSANHHFYPSPRGKNVFSPFFYRPWAFYQASRFRLLVCKIFLSLLFLFISVLAVFFFLLSSICAHINIWSTIIAVSHIMDNAQLRVMKKKNNKKIASLDKKLLCLHRLTPRLLATAIKNRRKMPPNEAVRRPSIHHPWRLGFLSGVAHLETVSRPWAGRLLKH